MNTEKTDLLAALNKHRGFLLHTVAGLTDEQAAATPTDSALCLGGLIKHVASVEERWIRFATGGAEAMESQPIDWEGQFRMKPGETLAGHVERYRQVAAETDAMIDKLDLNGDHELPRAPWFEQGARWSFRRVLLHVLAETSQHAGHADIIRETIDGQKTMG